MGLPNRSWRRGVAIAVLVGFLPIVSSGCFGRFNLTRKVYEFNDTVTRDKWAEWLVFLVFVIVPVYGIATLADAIVANSLEFWTGENPVMAGAEPARRVVQGADGSVAVLTLESDRSVSVRVVGADGSEAAFSLARNAGGVVARAPDGRLLAQVGEAASGLAIRAASPGPLVR